MPRGYFHVTSSVNRASIEKHGLDWGQMGAAHGIAGVPGASLAPEVEGIFLLESEDELEWFAQIGIGQGHQSVDVWEASLPDDAELIETDSGYSYWPTPIPSSAIRLVRADWTPKPRSSD
jgi:hypothetical protein